MSSALQQANLPGPKSGLIRKQLKWTPPKNKNNSDNPSKSTPSSSASPQQKGLPRSAGGANPAMRRRQRLSTISSEANEMGEPDSPRNNNPPNPYQSRRKSSFGMIMSDTQSYMREVEKFLD